mmetsp:Transcript_10069/g.39201  ORF Transcript_10069/g.39201 Transcript_10069/m.39201 type:complete len:397 (+) Transcript_10069:608-1798(+)
MFRLRPPLCGALRCPPCQWWQSKQRFLVPAALPRSAAVAHWHATRGARNHHPLPLLACSARTAAAPPPAAPLRLLPLALPPLAGLAGGSFPLRRRLAPGCPPVPWPAVTHACEDGTRPDALSRSDASNESTRPAVDTKACGATRSALASAVCSSSRVDRAAFQGSSYGAPAATPSGRFGSFTFPPAAKGVADSSANRLYRASSLSLAASMPYGAEACRERGLSTNGGGRSACAPPDLLGTAALWRLSERAATASKPCMPAAASSSRSSSRSVAAAATAPCTPVAPAPETAPPPVTAISTAGSSLPTVRGSCDRPGRRGFSVPAASRASMSRFNARTAVSPPTSLTARTAVASERLSGRGQRCEDRPLVRMKRRDPSRRCVSRGTLKAEGMSAGDAA